MVYSGWDGVQFLGVLPARFQHLGHGAELVVFGGPGLVLAHYVVAFGLLKQHPECETKAYQA